MVGSSAMVKRKADSCPLRCTIGLLYSVIFHSGWVGGRALMVDQRREVMCQEVVWASLAALYRTRSGIPRPPERWLWDNMYP